MDKHITLQRNSSTHKMYSLFGCARKWVFTSAFILLCSITFTAQERKVQEMYDARLYDEVVDYYATMGEKSVSKSEVALFSKALVRTGRVQEGVDLMKYVYLSHPESPVTISALAEALIYNDENAVAYYLLSEYFDDSDDIPEFYPLIKKASLLMDWESRETRLKVKPFKLINSEKNEFSIYKDGDQVIFCSSDIVELNDDMSKSKKDFTAIFELKQDDKKHVPFRKGEFKGKFNVGPFHMAEDKMYFTFSAEVEPGVNQLVIHETDRNEPSLSKSTPISLCSNEYSVAHPTVTADGLKMIFSSDMPGGEGGMDLYYSLRTPVGWSGAISMGESVNTPGNEVFPRVFKDTIYFASDGHPGYGGFDIYKVTDDMYHEDVRNVYAPINSVYDDFDLFIIDNEAGYFTSNRPGGKGGDDIWYYDLILVKENPELVSGILEVKSMPQENVRMIITDLEGNILEQAFTDKNGVFYFNRRPEGGEFNIKVADEILDSEGVDLYITDDQGEKVQKLTADANGNFKFELLAVDDYFIEYMDAEDNSLFSFTLRAQVFKDFPGDTNEPLSIASLNEHGIISEEASTTEHGYFEFNKMIPSTDYYFNILSKDPDLKIAIVDENDQISHILKRGENGRFYYQTREEDMNMIAIFDEDNVLISVNQDEAIKLENILYPVGRWDLNESSKTELSRLVGIMQNNENMTIELSSHTDSQGKRDSNSALSEKRAKAALSYIVSFGIDPMRVKAVGYGETKLLNDCGDGVRCNSNEHSINRRTEFKIISN